MGFKPENPDYELSPYTGLTRKHWFDAAKYLLDGVFSHVKDISEPVLVPRYEDKITYPNAGTPKWKEKAEIFEGLCRSFFIAAPLISEYPNVMAGGISLREYYKRQVLESCTPGAPNSACTYRELCELEGERESLNTYQETVESCALVICLWISKDVIWDTYTESEKTIILDFIEGYAKGATIAHNWRFFNLLDLAFLWMNGREIPEDMMRHHASALLNCYSGDGWYRDGNSFDYYSVWAFQVYAPIWCRWYGYEKEPWLAAKFEEYSNAFMENYPALFDRDGWVNMWGRSCLYRNAVTAGFDGNFFLRSYTVKPGLARRISSGALLQFLEREDVLFENSLNLGFYRPFLPMIQPYSCAESPLWAGKAFLCLHLPEEHPFWMEKETNGLWEELEKGETRETVLNGPGLCVANHNDNGTTELRSGKVIRSLDDDGGMCCYGKLSYNTKYPWEAFTGTGTESQMYLITEENTGMIHKPNALLWGGGKDGVLYRKNFFNYTSEKEMHWMHCVDLADFTVPEGIVRVDRLRFYKSGLKVTLGSYGFPDMGDVEIKMLLKEDAKAIVLKGYDSHGREKQMAMTVYGAWKDLGVVGSTETNADTGKSLILSASLKRETLYGYEPAICISQIITRESFADFTEDEIFSIRNIRYTDEEQCGGYGPVEVEMKEGRKVIIDYCGIEGNMSI